MGGRGTGRGFDGIEQGIAYSTDLQSGAIATSWSGAAYALSFSINNASFLGGYETNFGSANVINSSWGFTDSGGSSNFTRYIDAKAFQFRSTASVFSAGNTGPSTNTIGGAGSGYNSITVAALQNDGSDNYNTVASFSSRSPQDYTDPNGTVVGVRAAVDIAAPGTNLTAAFYGGTKGGNGVALGGADAPGAGPDSYIGGIAGTSFAAPIVSGGVSLLHSASIGEAMGSESRDTLVVKSVLQNSATKDASAGWDNGQSDVGGVITTTQSLDWETGAGAMNLDKAYDQYLGDGITQDVAGQSIGDQGLVSEIGWDLGTAQRFGFNEYTIDEFLAGGEQFNVTLNWFRDLTDNGNLSITDNAQADLTLEVFNVGTDSVIARSSSLYNVTEHLSFLIPETAQYGLRVLYGDNTFGATNSVDYGIAWYGVAIPEPSGHLLISRT